jgi:peptidoglycan/LPS O-acetylase OafA/YrhL
VRGVAVLTIMAVHHPALSRYSPGGFLGVDLFLVLSGFLITCLLLEEHARRGTISFRRFYARRALRLLPALWVMLGFCVLLALFSEVPVAAGIGWRKMLWGVLLVLCCAGNWAWVFSFNLFILGHAWSLGLEEQFYLLWPPVLALLLYWRVRRRTILLLVAGGVAASAALRAVLFHWAGDLYGGIFTILPTRADSLLAGCLVGLLACWNHLPRRGPGRTAVQVAGAVSVATLIYLGFRIHPCDVSLFYGVYLLTAAASALIVAAVASGPRRVLARALAAPPLVAAGRLAYGLYLWHFPVYGLLNHYLYKVWPSYHPSNRVDVALKFAASFALALVSFYCVERPFLRWKARLARV